MGLRYMNDVGKWIASIEVKKRAIHLHQVGNTMRIIFTDNGIIQRDYESTYINESDAINTIHRLMKEWCKSEVNPHTNEVIFGEEIDLILHELDK